MPGLPDTRYSLLARLAEPADIEAWSQFVELYEQAIFRYSRGRGLQDADAWEVVQKVLLIVHQKIGQWRPNGKRCAFRSWLLTTAHRVCGHAFREFRRRDRAVGGSSMAIRMNDLARDADKVEPHRDWQRWAFCWAAGLAEREVEPVTWNAFRLTAVEGLSATDTATRLGLKVGTVYTAKCRVIARIRELVHELSRSDL
jgi:RNA polymerase sigma-70 factor (ECF subfamily)